MLATILALGVVSFPYSRVGDSWNSSDTYCLIALGDADLPAKDHVRRIVADESVRLELASANERFQAKRASEIQKFLVKWEAEQNEQPDPAWNRILADYLRSGNATVVADALADHSGLKRALANSIRSVGVAKLASLEHFEVYSTNPSGLEQRLIPGDTQIQDIGSPPKELFEAMRQLEVADLSEWTSLFQRLNLTNEPTHEVRLVVSPHRQDIVFRIEALDARQNRLASLVTRIEFETIGEVTPIPGLAGRIEQSDVSEPWRTAIQAPFDSFAYEARTDMVPKDNPYDLCANLIAKSAVASSPTVILLDEECCSALLKRLASKAIDISSFFGELIQFGVMAKFDVDGVTYLTPARFASRESVTRNTLSQVQKGGGLLVDNQSVFAAHIESGGTYVPPQFLNLLSNTAGIRSQRTALPPMPLRNLLGIVSLSDWNNLEHEEGVVVNLNSAVRQSLLSELFEQYPFWIERPKGSSPFIKKSSNLTSCRVRKFSTSEELLAVSISGTQYEGTPEQLGDVLGQVAPQLPESGYRQSTAPISVIQVLAPNGYLFRWKSPAVATQEFGQPQDFADLSQLTRDELSSAFRDAREARQRFEEAARRAIKP